MWGVEGGTISDYLHPWRLTWNIIMEVWKIMFLSKWVICRFHVNPPGIYRVSQMPGHAGCCPAIVVLTFMTGVRVTGVAPHKWHQNTPFKRLNWELHPHVPPFRTRILDRGDSCWKATFLGSSSQCVATEDPKVPLEMPWVQDVMADKVVVGCWACGKQGVQVSRFDEQIRIFKHEIWMVIPVILSPY